MVVEIELPDPTVLIKLHGMFMVIAWIMCWSLGSTVASYFKKTWVTERYFGGEAWFLYHRLYMFFTWLLTCCGFILIFIDMDGFNEHAHAIVGIVTFILCFLQPIFGAINPQHKSKKFFRLWHILSGNLTYVLAITNMFLAVGLESAKLKSSLYGWLGGSVGFNVLIHATFLLLEHLSKKRGVSLDPTKDASFSRWRKVTLSVQLIGLFAFTVVIAVQIWLA